MEADSCILVVPTCWQAEEYTHIMEQNKNSWETADSR